jgi:TonB family protein
MYLRGMPLGRLSSAIFLAAVILAFCDQLPAGRLAAQTPDLDTSIYTRVDRSARVLPGQSPPIYPILLQGAQIEGEVPVQFVVDTAGRVEPASLKILASTHELFTIAVRERLRSLRFAPAARQGRPVRQLVVGAFEFPSGRAGGTWQWPPRPSRRIP